MRSGAYGAIVALLGAASFAGCGDPSGDVLLLSLTATSKVDTLDIRIKGSSSIVFEKRDEPVDPINPSRDISLPNEVLKLQFEFSAPGTYLLHIIGRQESSGEKQFMLHRYRIDGLVKDSQVLIPIAYDRDEDGFPACGSMSESACQQVSCDALDCADRDAAVNPLAEEVCGNLLDDDCSAGCGVVAEKGDEPCDDKDGDGVSSQFDCDDEDPCRSPKLKEAAKLCDLTAEEFPALPAGCLEKLGDKKIAPPYCGDGIDQDCNGEDIDCEIDEDCDGHSPPGDCDDSKPEIKPNAKEECDEIDNNCNGTVDEGCTPCDIDGDNHAAKGNDDASCTLPKDDPDDFDSGVHPGVTADTDGKEGGSVLTALRRFCSSDPDRRGTPQRQVDHDDDGDTAEADGCPEQTCDGDGDGFAGSQCAPPKSQEDCDDTDPTVFPGAPDKCGDSIKQNCVADVACEEITDSDGDGYAPPDDCADDDKDRFPWAVEKCDGLDNDCDGLIDEGNPGLDGVPMNQRCADDKDGKCFEDGPSGDCGCSQIVPSSVRDDDNRVACQGEDLSAEASPRCFGARQTVKEKCDDDDWDCDGRADDPTGRNLEEVGEPCSTDEGTCNQGTVVGCDHSQTLPNVGLIGQVLGSAFNPSLVCSADTLYPIPEVCNGKDDDCDGSIPDDEKDGDGDGYLPCCVADVEPCTNDCSIGSAREDLEATFKGCGDCRDDELVINPGALEICNGEDDNCSDGLDDDGEGECTGGASCCPMFMSCLDLSNDDEHCGSCTRSCKSGEHCSNGSCRCGNSPSCSSNLNCINGSCSCIENGNCSGCCDGGTCYSRSVTNCGVDGSSCSTCGKPGECEVAYCDALGECKKRDADDGTSCDDGNGRCRGGSCCKGDNCWNTANSKCEGGAKDDDKCGTRGAICRDCTAIGLDCVDASCQ